MAKMPRRLDYGEEATLVEHLGELRTRIFIALIALLVAFGVAYAFRGYLLDWLNAPLPKHLDKPVTFGVAEPFLTSTWVALWAGLIAATPVIVWQTWAFFAPAFQEHYQRTMATMVLFATALAAAGVAFGYYLALPAAVHFLTGFDDQHYTILLRAKDYYSFCVQVLVAVAVVFELPVVVIGLVQLRILSAHRLRKHWRPGLAICAAIAVALPGVDPITTLLEMIPMFALYGLSIVLATVIERGRIRRAAAAPAATGS